MENETNDTNVTVNINRGGFINLNDVETFIRETITRYEALGPLYIANYSAIHYRNGVWSTEVTITTRDPQAITNVFDFGTTVATGLGNGF